MLSDHDLTSDNAQPAAARRWNTPVLNSVKKTKAASPQLEPKWRRIHLKIIQIGRFRQCYFKNPAPTSGGPLLAVVANAFGKPPQRRADIRLASP